MTRVLSRSGASGSRCFTRGDSPVRKQRLRACVSALFTMFWALMLMQTTSVQAAQTAAAAQVAEPVRVVYHFDAGLEQASRALRNIRNHLVADPQARIEVVALASGIDFMIEGAKDAGGYPYDLVIQQLIEQGVRFKACANTLETRHLKASDLAEGVIVVPSGVAELARLQYREHFAYIKP